MASTEYSQETPGILIPMTFLIQFTVVIGLFLLAIRLMLPELPVGPMYTGALVLCSLIWSGFFHFLSRRSG